MKDHIDVLQKLIIMDDEQKQKAEKLHKEKVKFGIYEANLRHFKRQRKIFLTNLANAKNDTERYRIQRDLEFNKTNMNKTLAILAAVKQK